MNSFLVAVLVPVSLPSNVNSIGYYIKRALEPYDEKTPVDPYVVMTRPQLVAYGRTAIELQEVYENGEQMDKILTDDEIHAVFAKGFNSVLDDGSVTSTYNTETMFSRWEFASGAEFRVIQRTPASGLLADVRRYWAAIHSPVPPEPDEFIIPRGLVCLPDEDDSNMVRWLTPGTMTTDDWLSTLVDALEDTPAYVYWIKAFI